jgi:hypothetical protein
MPRCVRLRLAVRRQRATFSMRSSLPRCSQAPVLPWRHPPSRHGWRAATSGRASRDAKRSSPHRAATCRSCGAAYFLSTQNAAIAKTVALRQMRRALDSRIGNLNHKPFISNSAQKSTNRDVRHEYVEQADAEGFYVTSRCTRPLLAVLRRRKKVLRASPQLRPSRAPFHLSIFTFIMKIRQGLFFPREFLSLILSLSDDCRF